MANPRINSLDQFRGYTVTGMFLVNFLGAYTVMPLLLKHKNNFCSYADTIMPQFFFAVGMAYRLTYLRRRDRDGVWRARGMLIQRCLGLLLLGLVIYGVDVQVQTWTELEALGWRGFLTQAFERSYFQTLVHIAITSLWVLPVIASGIGTRICYALFSACLHVALSKAGYYDWVMQRPGIDGGPLGFLTWTIPLLFGSLAYDVVVDHRPWAAAWRLLLAGSSLCVVGYLLSCIGQISPGVPAEQWLVAAPFVPPSTTSDLWTMSQRAGSVSYQTFAAGFAGVIYAGFVVLSDRWRFQLPLFTTLGTNALAAYLIHGLVEQRIGQFTPTDTPLWYVLTMFGVFFAITWFLVRYLERNQIYLRL